MKTTTNKPIVSDKPKTPIVVQCFYCGATLTLNTDSMAARATRTDPREQMRQHIADHHPPAEVARHHYHTAWLIDMLFFRDPFTPDRWKDNIIAALEHYLEAES